MMELKPQQHVFLVYFGEDMIEHIIFHANLYAKQKKKPFKPVPRYKIKMFLGINIQMGIKEPHIYHDWWSLHEELRNVYKLIAFNRFRCNFLTHIQMTIHLCQKPVNQNIQN
jgi:hypothetical protein